MNRIACVLCCIVWLGCGKPEHAVHPDVSFYYWRTTFQLSDVEKKVLDQNHVAKLYVRYLDVTVKNNASFPESPVKFQEHPPQIKIVPVVYIRNAVMLLPDLSTETLAQKLVDYIDQINNRYTYTVDEIQLDCDWTLSSKDTFFQLVREIKARSDKKISVTIRLHQIKYAHKTGVPPADEGALMYYNMGMIAADSLNSIYDRTTAKRYIADLKNYPLSLKIALPIFSWGIHIRAGKVIDLLGKHNEHNFEADTAFVHKDMHYFEAKENVIRSGYYFQKGDLIKVESIGKDQLYEMAEDLSEHLSEKPSEIIFYDLDDVNLKPYEDDTQFFETISRSF